MPEIVALGPGHADVAAALHAACFPEDRWSAEALAALLGGPGALGLAIVEGDLPAGLLVARSAVDEAEILTIGIVPPARGRGLGRAMLEAALAALKGRGVARVFLEVGVSNAAARALYARVGFIGCGVRPDYYRSAGKTEDALVLSKDLGQTNAAPATG